MRTKNADENQSKNIFTAKHIHTPGCVVAMPVDSDDDSVCVTDVVAADVDSTAINRRHKPSSFDKTYTVL